MRRRRPLGLTDPEIHSLLRAAGESRRTQAKRNYAIIQLLLQTVVRVGELVTLQVGDAKMRDRSGELRIHGKGTKERELPLNASARRALRLYLEARVKAVSEEPLFLSERGRECAKNPGVTLPFALVISCGFVRNFGYQRWNNSSSSSFKTLVRVCSNRWAPRSVHCIDCFLTKRRLTT